jgi:lipoate-protein ligase A
MRYHLRVLERSAPRWRFILDPPASGAHNMAVDEAILEAVAAGQAPPTLRFYGWTPPCLSLGAHQRAGAFDRTDCRDAGVEVVRRPSGGGATLHQYELTFAVIASLGDPSFAGGPRLAYRRISHLLRAGLGRLGVHLDIPAPSPAPRADVCFTAIGPYELTVGGRKLAGSAQLRRRGAFLQHGSILLDVDPDLQRRLLGPAGDPTPHLISLAAVLGRVVAPGALARAIRTAFLEAGAAFEDAGLTSDEAARVSELCVKYRSERWTARR